MAEYLVFRLYGPLASWGEIAVGESRHSAAHPSRSALLGLLGAALGVLREDETGQQRLFASFRFGVKLAAVGTPLRDYHTVQMPPHKGKIVHRTRRQELADPPRLGTLLSSREYRCDSLAVIAAEAMPNASWTLEQVSDALRAPHFVLYLGRKSCVPALPLAPRRMETPTLRDALDSFQVSLSSLVSRNARSKLAPQNTLLQNEPEMRWPSRMDHTLFHAEGVRYFWENDMHFGEDDHYMEQIRNDQPLSRARWQFAPRREWVYLERTPQKEKP